MQLCNDTYPPIFQKMNYEQIFVLYSGKYANLVSSWGYHGIGR